MNTESEAGAVARFYDELDSFYREAWGERLHHGLWLTGRESIEEALDNLEALIFNRAEIRSGDRVLDIGCGYGTLARTICDRFEVDSVVGITNSEAQFRRAKSASLLQLVHGEWLANELPANSFDVAISVECLSHVADKSAFFREAARVLRPGARFVLVCWSAGRRNPPAWARNLILKSGQLAGIASPREIQQLLDENGFQTLEVLDLSREAAPTWSKMARRLAGLAFSRRKFAREWIFRPIRSLKFALTAACLILAFKFEWIGYEIRKAKL